MAPLDRCGILIRDPEPARRWVFALLLLMGLVSARPASAQHPPVPEVSVPIVLSTDAGPTQTLTLGYDPAAANDADDGFDKEAPPPPPSSAFDARLIDANRSLWSDIRAGAPGFDGTNEHRVRFQTQDEATEVTIAWILPDGITGTIEDESGGDSYGPKSMSGEGSITIAPDAPDALVRINYSGSQAPINIHPARIREDGPVGFRNTGVDIDVSGVSTAGTVTLTKFRNGPDGTDGISENNVSTYRFVVEPGDLSVDSATLQLADSTLAGMDDPSAVQVYRRASPGDGSFASVPTDVSDDGTEVLATTDAFGEFVLASDSAPLPVELTHFAARRNEQAAVLRWRTASETNNAGFAIEHKAPTAAGYAEVGFVDAAVSGGTTSTSTTYRYEVPRLEPGTHRFRLRQVDTDGTSHRSASVSVSVPMDRGLRLAPPSPNPARTTARFRFGVRSPGTATIQIYNVLGQRVATLYEGTPAPGRIQLLRVGPQVLADLPSGVYLVRLTAQGAHRTRRLTIAR